MYSIVPITGEVVFFKNNFPSSILPLFDQSIEHMTVYVQFGKKNCYGYVL